VGAGGSII
jgi:hypothetical protein